MLRLFAAVLLAAALSLVSVASAFAHVHGVTPLNCPTGLADSVPNNPNAGGQATQGIPPTMERADRSSHLSRSTPATHRSAPIAATPDSTLHTADRPSKPCTAR